MDTLNPLDGRVAVVTGASSGIGVATARRLAAGGAAVALIARRADRLDALASELGDRALPVAADATDPDALDAAAASIADRLGAPDLVVANAGVMLPAPFEEGRRDDWLRMVDLNLVGVLDTLRAFLPGVLSAADADRPADLVVVSSLAARATFPGYAVYCATKAAVTHLAAGLRAELGGRGVRVTNVEPGLIDTELADHIGHDAEREALAQWRATVGTLVAEDVADAIAHVAGRPAHVHLGDLLIQPTRQAVGA
ncbi:MAG TPA: SDR family oxidoreductase [Capillimicrobium sp.]|nr:SDR family oxidoreductase [Capillimicrobium sp.]